ncbi:hypothetical protein PG984_013948 [Apiospora sp. TS-2023a]
MPPRYEAVPTDQHESPPQGDIEMNIQEQSSGNAGPAGMSTPSANTTRTDGMNSSPGLAMGTERLVAEPTSRVSEASLKATQTW